MLRSIVNISAALAAHRIRRSAPAGRAIARAHWIRRTLLATLAIAGLGAELTACADRTGIDPPSAIVPQPAPLSFPLRLGVDSRYLLDATGKPVLIHGDAAWSLIAEPSLPDAEYYLADRARRGFNAVVVSLLEHKFARHAPKDRAGDRPFAENDPFGTPNERYFAHADEVIAGAAQHGMLVLLAPAYLGFGGGDEGWYAEAKRAGAERLAAYGRFLGARYGHAGNIVWLLGGDFEPPDGRLVRALAEGIRAADPQAVLSAHCSRGRAASACWGAENWLQVDTIYTAAQVREPARAHAAARRGPFLLIEAVYEGAPSGSARTVRAEAYEALLSGAAGEVYGHETVWHFDGPGVQPANESWKQALDSAGARHVGIALAVIRALPWWTLVPDLNDGVSDLDAPSPADHATAAVDQGHTLALVYIPNGHRVRVGFEGLTTPATTAVWIDPTTGARRPAAPVATESAGARLYDTRDTNQAGDRDWLLLFSRAAVATIPPAGAAPVGAPTEPRK